MESVFSGESAEKQTLRLALITSKMICNSLYGELKEIEQGEIYKQYQATFIAESSAN